MKHVTLTAALLAGATSAYAVPVDWHAPYSGLVIFGDSMDDPGNYDRFIQPLSDVYYQGEYGRQYSNGPVWSIQAQEVFENNGKFWTNYAFGDAKMGTDNDGVPDFERQLNFYEQDVEAGLLNEAAFGDRPLVSVGFGTNDLYALARGADPATIISNATAGFLSGMNRIAAKGVRDIVYWNLPDVNITPRVQLDAENADALRGVIQALNENFRGVADDLRDSGVNVIEIEYYAAANEVVNNPDLFGLTNVTDQCVTFNDEGYDVCSDEATTLFYDDNHPNARGHEIAYETFATTVANAAPSPVPLPASFWLLGGAVFTLSRRRRSNG